MNIIQADGGILISGLDSTVLTTVLTKLGVDNGLEEMEIHLNDKGEMTVFLRWFEPRKLLGMGWSKEAALAKNIKRVKKLLSQS